jgi:hypothetical protein
VKSGTNAANRAEFGKSRFSSERLPDDKVTYLGSQPAGRLAEDRISSSAQRGGGRRCPSVTEDR